MPRVRTPHFCDRSSYLLTSCSDSRQKTNRDSIRKTNTKSHSLVVTDDTTGSKSKSIIPPQSDDQSTGWLILNFEPHSSREQHGLAIEEVKEEDDDELSSLDNDIKEDPSRNSFINDELFPPPIPSSNTSENHQNIENSLRNTDNLETKLFEPFSVKEESPEFKSAEIDKESIGCQISDFYETQSEFQSTSKEKEQTNSSEYLNILDKESYSNTPVENENSSQLLEESNSDVVVGVVVPKPLVVFKILANKLASSRSVKSHSSFPNNPPSSMPCLNPVSVYSKPDSTISNAKRVSVPSNAEPVSTLSSAKPFSTPSNFGQVTAPSEVKPVSTPSIALASHDRFNYFCRDCLETFSSPIDFMVHKNAKHDTTSINNFAEKSHQKKNVDEHQESAKNITESQKLETSKPNDESEENDKEMSKKNGLNYCCHKCKKDFSSFINYRYHIRNVHSIQIHAVSNSETGENLETLGSVCPFCKDEFVDVTSHIMIHHHTTQYICPECNKTFDSEDKIMRHIAAVHDGPRPFQCSQCECSFAVETDLKSHQITHPNPIHGITCRKCEQRFSSRAYLMRHFRVAHHAGSQRIVSEDNFTEGVVKIVEVETEKSFLYQKKKKIKKPTMTIPEHYCQKCKKEFEFASEFEWHIRSLHSLETTVEISQDDPSKRKTDVGEQNQHKCNQLDLELHGTKLAATVHLSKFNYICGKCGKSFSILAEFLVHRNGKQCVVGNTDTKSSEIQSKDITQKSPKEASNYYCYKCKKEFTSFINFSYHNNMHSGQEINNKPEPIVNCRKSVKVNNAKSICPICKKKFINISSHILRAHQNSIYLCSDCDKKFDSDISLLRHGAAKHGGAKPFLCTRCDRSFAVNIDLQLHELEHDNPPQSITVYCQKCKNGFSSTTLLQRHLCPINSVSAVPSSDSYLISKRCRKPSSKNRTPKQCPFCDNEFVELKAHISRMHDRNHKYPCPECNMKFVGTDARRRHVAVKHNNGPGFLCHTCGRRFLAKTNLKSHELTHNERNLMCDYCESKFKEKYTLAAHCRQHGDIRPYKCNYCKMRFRQTVRRKVHQIRKHTKAFPILCHSCGQKFVFLNELKNHKKKKGCE